MTGREGVMVTNWAEVERCCTGARKGHSTTNPSVCLAQSQLASHPAMLSLLIVSSSVTSYVLVSRSWSQICFHAYGHFYSHRLWHEQTCSEGGTSLTFDTPSRQ